jgi:hypothetical protein
MRLARSTHSLQVASVCVFVCVCVCVYVYACTRNVGGWMYLQACALQLAPQSYVHKRKHAARTHPHPHKHTQTSKKKYTHLHLRRLARPKAGKDEALVNWGGEGEGGAAGSC